MSEESIKKREHFKELANIKYDELIGMSIKIIYDYLTNSMTELEKILNNSFQSSEFVNEVLLNLYKRINEKIEINFDAFEEKANSSVFSVKKLDTEKYSMESMVEELSKLQKENYEKEILVQMVLSLLHYF
jgi:translation elongation factor EF-Ts